MEMDVLAHRLQVFTLVWLIFKAGLAARRTMHSLMQHRQIQPMLILTLPQSAQLLQ